MVKASELRVGLLLWWTRTSSRVNNWSCPCIVTEVNEDTFRVRSLDDFKETSPPLAVERKTPDGDDESSLCEMEVCDPEKVREYLQEMKHRLQDKVTSAKRLVEKCDREHSDYCHKAAGILNDILLAEAEKRNAAQT